MLNLLTTITLLFTSLATLTAQDQGTHTSPIKSEQIIDQLRLLSPRQIAKVQEAQQNLYQKFNCRVTYGFYNDDLSNITVLQDWKRILEKDQNTQPFHIFVNIGMLQNGNHIELYYRYPPQSEDDKLVDRIFESIETELQSDLNVDELIEKSSKSLNDKLPNLITQSASETSDQSVNSTEYIIDPLKKLTTFQYSEIQEAQTKLREKYQSIVTYGFYDANLPNIEVLQKWQKLVGQDTEKPFHIFLNIGILQSSHIVEVHYRYPPGIKDPKEIDQVFSGLETDLQSEIGTDNLLNRSFESLENELSYFSNKPVYEAGIKEEQDSFELEKLKAFIYKIAKITGIVLGSIISLLLIFLLFSKFRNRSPYSFPEVVYTKRLGVKYAATSISQKKN